ncbi:WD40 repeat-like protein [Saccharata proteae CBS 121410]|uniref:WD40 repeat-like protein n=1 Tax=Saccharata proteae CBS 121410 TaxID=1314787 RepID=A0A9P4M060_9PEZI|nr:WD40 repeat-like protein [Saccharata proteae CBS 121410]
MKTAKLLATSDLSLPPDSYIYTLRSANNCLAALSSDNSIRLFDPTTLRLLPDGILNNVHDSVTCLEPWDAEGNVLATAGRDGSVRCWDLRSKSKVMEFKTPKPLPLSALTTSSLHNTLITGTELPDNPPGDAPIHIFDPRNPVTPRLSLLESHTDTITELVLHPQKPSTLLSASTDGLVNIFDLNQSDEDDALRQVINHGSAVHRAGFVGGVEGRDVYAFGTDETVAFYEWKEGEEDADEASGEETKPVRIGDVREMLGCEYVVGNKHLDLLNLRQPPEGQPLQYSCAQGDGVRLPGAHGEEIVRDIYFDAQSSVIFTCGEDGKVRSWKDEEQGEGPSSTASASKSRKEKKKSDKAKKEKERFKPY